MRQEELQAVQAPLKQRYRDDEQSAVVILRAAADLDSVAVSCSVQTGLALVEAGLHPASGGDGTLACSGDMLLQALVACAGVTLRSVAVNRDIALSGGRITAAGELDFRGTMGVDRDAPVGFRAIDLRFELDPGLSPEDVETLLKLTERYCVVYQTISKGVAVTISHDPPA
ncbi:MAG TPA: OsmC family protein [Solirubrobacteraceae bacterium]|nr:OsmC family protein [Solirubrobacteraceae bacterium]